MFVIFKLANVITWSWLWVTAPLWIGLICWVICVFVVFVVAGSVIEASRRRPMNFVQNIHNA